MAQIVSMLIYLYDTCTMAWVFIFPSLFAFIISVDTGQSLPKCLNFHFHCTCLLSLSSNQFKSSVNWRIFPLSFWKIITITTNFAQELKTPCVLRAGHLNRNCCYCDCYCYVRIYIGMGGTIWPHTRACKCHHLCPRNNPSRAGMYIEFNTVNTSQSFGV